MKDITTLIDKYGADIVKQLNIASSELYSKVLWYIRIGGLKDFVSDIIFIFIGIVMMILIHKFIDKNIDLEADVDPAAYLMTHLFAYFIAFFVWIFLCFVVIAGTTSDLMRLVAPEYWIIEQIVNQIKQ